MSKSHDRTAPRKHYGGTSNKDFTIGSHQQKKLILMFCLTLDFCQRRKSNLLPKYWKSKRNIISVSEGKKSYYFLKRHLFLSYKLFAQLYHLMKCYA